MQSEKIGIHKYFPKEQLVEGPVGTPSQDWLSGGSGRFSFFFFKSSIESPRSEDTTHFTSLENI